SHQICQASRSDRGHATPRDSAVAHALQPRTQLRPSSFASRRCQRWPTNRYRPCGELAQAKPPALTPIAVISLLSIDRLIELKLASGLSAPHRLRDLADVLELIRIAGLPRELAEELDASVREKYIELWESAQEADRIRE
ncbi:MAG TPA: hypothetical protein VM534_06750, partial [Thermoanaerobaculia bacterium]|nr:hypothetical protein [Thermoanaerobaculia bacterium]